MDFTEKKSVENPQIRANFLTNFFFFWILPLFLKGENQDLTLDDLYDRLPEDDAGFWGSKLEREWEKESRKAKASGKKPSLIRAVWNILGTKFTLLGLLVLFDELVLRSASPFALRAVLHSFSEEVKSDENLYLKQYLYTSGLILVTWAHCLMFQKIFFAFTHVAWKARIATASLIYRKVLKLTKTVQMEEANIGKLVNMLSNDSNRFDFMAFHFHMLYVAPIQSGILFYFLWEELGVSCLTGIVLILGLLIPLQAVVGRLSVKFRTQISKRGDDRGRMMNEIISGIRIIKMYAWEKPFASVINQLRKLEINTIKKGQYLGCLFQTLMQIAKMTIPYSTFMVYFYLGNTLTAEKVYFSISIYGVILLGMVNKTPLAMAQLGEFIVAIRRIEGFLTLEEMSDTNFNKNCILPSNSKMPELSIKPIDGEILEKATKEQFEPRIQMSSLTAKWTDVKITLDNISLDISGNKLVMLVGPVGAGKSSILSLLTYELPINSGKFNIWGTVSYASQDVWIFSGSIKQNILFGSFLNEKNYKFVINACALNEDLAQLPYGDDTIVGERGITLSGGQKSRISLARALYQEADIYLMDDPLSAVDSRVSRHLFDRCIKEHLNGKLRILVTHQLQYLPQADHIIVLNEHGKLMSQGNYTELLSQGIDFVQLMGSTTNNHEDSMDDSSNAISNVSQNGQSKPSTSLPILNVPKDKDDRAESMMKGSVSLKTYWAYFKSGDSKIELIIIILSFFVTQGAISFTEIWLSKWTNVISKRSISSDYSEGYSDQVYVLVYSIGVLTVAVVLSTRSIVFFHYCMSISRRLHDKMLLGLIRAPVKFFDENSSGRIINRFTKDLNSIDELLPMAFYDTIKIFLSLIAVVIVVTTRNYFVAIPAAFLVFGLWRLRRFYIKTARDLKRLESISKSPEFAHLTASVQGLTTIRALGAEEKLIDQFDSILDIHTSAFYLILVGNRWFGICLDAVSVLFLSSVAFSFILLGYNGSVEIGTVGLAITLTLNLLSVSQWGIRQSAETENNMTAVERAFEYCEIVPEAPLETDKDKKPPKDWPVGGIKFCNVTLSYDDANEVKVLKDLSFEIKPKEKVGIVGRTGAGKSSVLVALYRLTEPQGEIFIDNVPISQLGLHELRKNISIIPQDPVLFSGTMRYNLDPFDQFKDDELWQVLKEVNLRDAVPSLDFKVSDGGSNFSVGERQLVCLARAILRKNKIIVMDEATANVDPVTDNLIQHEIRERFADCTIITIAHRLHSVMSCDRILVFDKGCLMEFDTPANLLQNPDGIFTSMVNQVGPSGEAHLRKLATGSH